MKKFLMAVYDKNSKDLISSVVKAEDANDAITRFNGVYNTKIDDIDEDYYEDWDTNDIEGRTHEGIITEEFDEDDYIFRNEASLSIISIDEILSTLIDNVYGNTTESIKAYARFVLDVASQGEATYQKDPRISIKRIDLVREI